MSYTIDIYRNKLKPTNDFIAFMAFVSFFPQLVAGPIERATHLLPQFYNKRNFDYDIAVDGLKQMLWGFFKKLVIADNAAPIVNQIFQNYDTFPGSILLLGAFFFAFQIYGDFSGYSDIAIGTAKLFGYDLMQNFKYPYFSRDIAEFWRRWHISLSSWFKDYLYITLGGSRCNTWKKIRNVFIIFIVSGFWHGAKWTFIVWGLLNAIYFLPLILLNKNRVHINTVAEGKYLPTIKELFQMTSTFILTAFAWIFFRAENMNKAISYLGNIFSNTLFDKLYFPTLKPMLTTTILIFIFILIEWIGRHDRYAIETIGMKWNKIIRYAMYYLIIIAIILISSKQQQQFIYFQF